MNNNLYIDELLDELVKGKITRQQAEPVLQQENIGDVDGEIELHRSAVIALQQYSVMMQVQQVHKYFISTSTTITGGEKKTTGKLVSYRPLKWAIRIAAMLIIALGGWFTYQYVTVNSSKLYTEIYQPYNLNTDRSEDSDLVTHDMLQQFKDNNFAAVIKTFQSLSTTNNREKFLAAYAWHETDDYEQAIIVLQQILQDNIQTGGRLYNDEAEFYLGLSYLKMKNNDDAFSYFKIIRDNPSHTFHERVSKWTITRLKWLK